MSQIFYRYEEVRRQGELSPEVSVREKWRVRGDYVVPCDDSIFGKIEDDSLCYVFYPLDLPINSAGVPPAHLTEDTISDNSPASPLGSGGESFSQAFPEFFCHIFENIG
ncbi:MAG: hypothetical protein Q4D62_04845 [Planctomycetia bacterium]|nr:hypothetical protein [Planctomycetia bacterium]